MSLRRKSRTSVAYPTAGEFLARPNALPEHLPSEWRPLIATGNLAAFSIVAPLFEHGKGHAVDGCMVMAPPVFLTEEEARQIIIEELAKVGIKLARQGVTLENAPIRSRKINWFEQDGKIKSEAIFDNPQPMMVDLLDPDKNIAVEFISEEDHNRQWAARTGLRGSVSHYDFQDAAQELIRQLKETRTATHFGVFYDPATEDDWSAHPTVEEREGKTPQEVWRQMEEVALSESREQLRQQVRDFAAWLREQGVI